MTPDFLQTLIYGQKLESETEGAGVPSNLYIINQEMQRGSDPTVSLSDSYQSDSDCRIRPMGLLLLGVDATEVEIITHTSTMKKSIQENAPIVLSDFK